MGYQILHNNFNVLNLQRSIDFYREALGLTEIRRKVAEDGSYIFVFLGYPGQCHQVELTWLRDRETPYDLGDNEIHLAFETDNYEESYQHHEEMGCICFVNEQLGLYYIEDPDGYWLEIIPKR